jgi:cytochrome P450 family 4
MIVLLLLLLILSLFLWYQNKYQRRDQLLTKIPSSNKLFLVHNSLEFYGKSQAEMFQIFEEKRKTLGPVYNITLGLFDDGIIVVSDPKIAEEILSKSKFMNKGHIYNVLKSWIDDGLLTSTGSKWEKRRKVLSTAFHFEMLEKYVEIMNSKVKVLVEILTKLGQKEVEIERLMTLYSLDVLCGM